VLILTAESPVLVGKPEESALAMTDSGRVNRGAGGMLERYV
jgi:hypothetical protein